MGALRRLFGGTGAKQQQKDKGSGFKSQDFELVEPPAGGPAVAKCRGKSKSCFIDRSGRKVIEVPQPYSAGVFQEGMCLIQTLGAGAAHGFMDKKGKLVVKPSYRSANYFSEGLAAVATAVRTWGFIDKTGKTVIPLRYSEVGSFHEELAAARTPGGWGFIDHQGKTVIRPNDAWREVSWFSEGTAAIKRDNKWGFIDKKGREIIAARFDQVSPFAEGLAAVKSGALWGYINKAGKWAIEPTLQWAGRFSESLAAVSQPYRYIEPSGNVAIDFAGGRQPEGLGAFQGGLAAVKIDGRWGFIDKSGTATISNQFESSSAPSFAEGLAAITKDGKKCYINRRGDIVIETDADHMGPFSEGLAGLHYFG